MNIKKNPFEIFLHVSTFLINSSVQCGRNLDKENADEKKIFIILFIKF